MMIIRKFRKTDAEEVYRLVSSSFADFVSSDFSKKGIEKFLKEMKPEIQIERAKTRDIYVAVHEKKIVGMIESDSNGINRLFVDKKYHGKGIATELMKRTESLFRKRKISRIVVHSSLYAVKFYEKMGYRKSRGIVRKYGFVYQPMKKNL